MLSDDGFRYNHRPADHLACCQRMTIAIEKTGSVTVLGNYKHTIETSHVSDVLDYCPWCTADLRPLVSR